MTVNGNYSPNVIEAEPGVPLRIKVDHPSPGGCDETLVFPDLGISRRLPPMGKDELVVPALQPGQYRFTCQMNMLSGTLVVE